MSNQRPIVPSPEQVDQWFNDAVGSASLLNSTPKYCIATQAAQWGADQELEACCEWVSAFSHDDCYYEDKLRNARRPKPPSLKEQALEQLDEISTCFRVTHMGDIVCDKIRAALEALPND